MAVAERWALAAAAMAAMAMPAVLLPPRAVPAAGYAAPVPIVVPAPSAPPVAIYRRDLFGSAPDGTGELPPDAPELVGIVGRIDQDAVALVRGSDGRARTLAVGAGIDGWTLESLAIDAAAFRRGDRLLRVPLPAG